jgi:hypothetical protein
MEMLRKLRREANGTEIVEFAVVVPVLFAVLLAIFYFGRAYNVYGTVTQAAMQGARAAVVSSCATCGNAPLGAAQIATQVVGPTLQASHLDVTQVKPLSPAPSLCPCGSPACGSPVACDPAGTGATPSICVQQNVILTTTASATQACGTSVSFYYPYSFNLIDLPLPMETFSLQLKATAEMQTENNQ